MSILVAFSIWAYLICMRAFTGDETTRNSLNTVGTTFCRLFLQVLLHAFRYFRNVRVRPLQSRQSINTSELQSFQFQNLRTRGDSVISAFSTLGTREDLVLPAFSTLGTREDSAILTFSTRTR